MVDQYLKMEKEKSWKNFDEDDDMLVLTLERELLAEQEGISLENLPPIDIDIELPEEEPVEPEVLEVQSSDEEESEPE